MDIPCHPETTACQGLQQVSYASTKSSALTSTKTHSRHPLSSSVLSHPSTALSVAAVSFSLHDIPEKAHSYLDFTCYGNGSLRCTYDTIGASICWADSYIPHLRFRYSIGAWSGSTRRMHLGLVGAMDGRDFSKGRDYSLLSTGSRRRDMR